MNSQTAPRPAGAAHAEVLVDTAWVESHLDDARMRQDSAQGRQPRRDLVCSSGIEGR